MVTYVVLVEDKSIQSLVGVLEGADRDALLELERALEVVRVGKRFFGLVLPSLIQGLRISLHVSYPSYCDLVRILADIMFQLALTGPDQI